MSDNWICIIPRSPTFVPAETAIERAEDYLAELAPEAEEIMSEVSYGVRFRDCGANLERISCPVCDASISTDWWTEQMGEGFELAPLTLLCGHRVPSLNDLQYHWDQGFSRFIVEAMNPNVGLLEPEQVSHFEAILGCKVRVVYQHI